MRTIYLDIETIALPLAKRDWGRPTMDTIKLGNIKDPAKAQAKLEAEIAEFEAGSDAALSPMTGRVALLGYAIDAGPVMQLEDEDEGDLLLQFVKVLRELDGDEKHNLQIVGHNSVGFDAPFLARRCLIMDARLPAWLTEDIYQYRPRYWKDTMRVWAFGDRQSYTKLEDLCAVFGIPVDESPEGVTGATFGEHWRHNKPACRAYNEQDVEATRVLWGYIGERAANG